MKNKEKGFLLFEFLLTSLLGSLLLLIFYQTYKAIQKSTQYISVNAEYETSKNAFFFYLENDTLRSLLPYSFPDLFSEKDKKKRDLFFSDYIQPFMPSLKKDDKEISFSFISYNKKIMHEIEDPFAFILVRYVFEKTEDSNADNAIYALVRYEGELDDSFHVKKQTRSLLVDSVVEPEVYFIVPDESELKKDNVADSSKKESESWYNQWQKKPGYKDVDRFPVEEKEYKNMSVPISIFVKYSFFSRKNDKKYITSHLVTFPTGQGACRSLLNEKEKDNENKK